MRGMRTPWSRAELRFIETLSPKDDFKLKVRTLRTLMDEWCGSGPLYVYVADGARSAEDQLAKWRVGRVETSPGVWKVVGKTITKAPPGSSAHEVALAADLGVVDSMDTASRADDAWVPDYVRNTDGTIEVHPAWAKLGEYAKTLGLQTGLHWKRPWDFGHVEHPDWKTLGR